MGSRNDFESALPAELTALLLRFGPGWPAYVEVSAGWYMLVADLDRELNKIDPSYVLRQVKSKFGRLRFDASPTTTSTRTVRSFDATIAAAEELSASICEECGQIATQRQDHGWLVTVCDVHTPREV